MTFFYPAYDRKQTLYWVVWVFVLLYVIGTGIYLGFFVHNVNFLHSWFTNPGAPGDMLVSFRGSFTSVAVRMTVFSHVLSIFFIMTLLSFRKFYGCNILWFVFYIVCFALSLAGLGALSASYANCNRQNQHGNICNDRRYCCPPEIYSNLANKCPNTLPCDPPVTVDDLRPNLDFQGLFWLNFILIVFQAAFIGLTIWVIYRKEPKEGEEEEDQPESKTLVDQDSSFFDKEPPKEEKNLANRIVTRSMIKKSHGLRQRN